MKVYIALVLVILGLAFYVSIKDQQTADKGTQPSGQSPPAATPQSPHEDPTSGNTKQPNGHPPSWYGFFRWPEGITVWAIILTLIAIAHQTHETAKSARASSEQVSIAKSALVSSFRPKIVLRSAALNPRNLADYQAGNEGIWKIELLLVNTGSTQATIESCELEFEWGKDDPVPWDTKPRAICAQKWVSFVIRPAGRFPLEVDIPHDSGFSITFDLIVQNLKNPHGGRQTAWPTCRGTIIYSDENGHKRQTGFCRRWDISAERFLISEDPDLEYQD
jgi:hypothetical protein